MRPDLTAREIGVLLARCTRGTALLVWDGVVFHRVTPEALRDALRAAGRQENGDEK